MPFACLLIDDQESHLLQRDASQTYVIQKMSWHQLQENHHSFHEYNLVMARVDTSDQAHLCAKWSLSCPLVLIYDDVDQAIASQLIKLSKPQQVSVIKRDHFNQTFFHYIVDHVVKLEQWDRDYKDLMEEVTSHRHLKTLGEISAQVAHEMNNILHGVSLASDIIHKKLYQGHDVKPLIGKLKAFTAKGQSVARHILDLSKESEEDHEIIDFYQLVEDLRLLLEISIPEEVQLSIINLHQSCYVLGHDGQITQVLMNLVRNAAHATHDKGEITIDVRHDDEQKLVQIRVSDNGHGIRKDHMDKIFKPLFTTKRKRDGTGLGLAFVKKVMDKHKGAIAVDSVLDEGTTFTLSFPVVDEIYENQEPIRELTPMHFILVNNNEMERTLLAANLMTESHQVTEFSNVEKAILYLNDHQDDIDVVICDHSLQAHSGVDLKHLSSERFSNLMVILSSGVPLSQDELGGGVHVLYKPYNYNDLKRLVLKR